MRPNTLASLRFTLCRVDRDHLELSYRARHHPQAKHLPNYPRLLSRILVEDGVSRQELFDGLDFGPDDLDDEAFRLTADQHERFIKRTIALSGGPHLAFRMSRKTFDATYSAVLMAIANSGQISRALHLFTRYNKIFTRTLSVRAVETGGETILEIEPHLSDEAVTYFAISSMVFFLDSFFMEALKGAHLVARAELSVREPEGFAAIRRKVGFPISFAHAKTRVFLTPDLIDAPLRQADPQTVRLMTELCERQLEEANADEDIVAAVTTLLLDHISSPPRLDQAADILHLSPRSLRRKLQQSGTTYQSILDAVRLRLATRLLRETREPVSAIAYEIGFESPSHFGRAFKTWTGQSPSSYRNV
jgi:AraC-like DNA-binding protein